jgi:hypothetical protein
MSPSFAAILSRKTLFCLAHKMKLPCYLYNRLSEIVKGESSFSASPAKSHENDRRAVKITRKPAVRK